MKNKLTQIRFLSTKINRHHLQLLWTLIILMLLILGIGAPADGGGGSV